MIHCSLVSGDKNLSSGEIFMNEVDQALMLKKSKKSSWRMIECPLIVSTPSLCCGSSMIQWPWCCSSSVSTSCWPSAGAGAAAVSGQHPSLVDPSFIFCISIIFSPVFCSSRSKGVARQCRSVKGHTRILRVQDV